MIQIDAVKGSNHSAPVITWKYRGGTVVTLTGATITGYMRDFEDEDATPFAIDGTLALYDGAAGQFSWSYGSNDIGTVGSYLVTFLATFGDSTIEKNLAIKFVVHEAMG